MNINLRRETPADHSAVAGVIALAFKGLDKSDGTEGELVNKLRTRKNFISALSIVAEADRKVIGYILFTEIEIIADGKSSESLALAPIAVLPEFQKQGIGGSLIMEGLKKAADLGFSSVVILGHPNYYPRFGFKPASVWNIKAPMKVPDINFMAVELRKDALTNVSGTVKYPPEFGI